MKQRGRHHPSLTSMFSSKIVGTSLRYASRPTTHVAYVRPLGNFSVPDNTLIGFKSRVADIFL